MKKMQKYTVNDRMCDLIGDNYSLIQVMSRFGISLGVGDKTVGEVCVANNVDTATFLAIVNFMTDGFPTMGEELKSISIPALIEYLRQSHSYFLDFCLPAIRRKLIEAIAFSEDDITFLILKSFDEYTSGIRKHMEFEDEKVFSYAEQLLRGELKDNYKIKTYSKHHDKAGETLTELKNIIIRYCPKQSNVNLLNTALFDIYTCEEGLEWHSKVEDWLFVPAILSLERGLHNECK